MNYIVDGERTEKYRMELPEKVNGIMKCKNPRCITNVEKVEDILFTLKDIKNKEYSCEYCDSVTRYEE